MVTHFNNYELLKIILRWKWHILFLMTLGILFSIIFSGPAFIKPKYKSFAILYPANISAYSSETPTEQMLQIFKSNDIKDSIIERFDLATHYRINKTNPTYEAVLSQKFDKNCKVRKTEFESVYIECLDEDPQIACDIVKSMIDLFNTKIANLHKEKDLEVVKIKEKLLLQKKIQIDSLESKMDVLRKEHGILDYYIQAKEYTRQYLRTINNSSKKDNQNMAAFLKRLGSDGGEFLLLGGYLSSATGVYNQLLVEYEIALSNYNKKMTYTNIISHPEPVYKKAYPIRWLIVAITALTTLVFSVLIIAMIESNHRI